MYGESEVKENLRQYCIQKEYPKKYFDYLECFIDKNNSNICLKQSGLSAFTVKKVIDKCRYDTDKEFEIMNDLKKKYLVA